MVLTRVKDVVTSFTITSSVPGPASTSPASSEYGQDVTYTATITLEAGATLQPGTTIQFTLDAADSFTPYTGGVNTVFVSPTGGNAGTASYDPQTLNDILWTVGTHTIDATFVDPNVNVQTASYSPAYPTPPAQPFDQDVSAAPTITAAASLATDVSALAQTLNLSATVSPNPAPPEMAAPAPVVNEGTVTFAVYTDATLTTQIGATTAPAAVSGGMASAAFTLPAGYAAGTYTIVATYSDPGASANYQTSSDSTHTLTVNPDMTLTPTPANLPGGDVNVAYTRVITVANGTAPYTSLTVTGFTANGTGLAAPTVNAANNTVTFNSTPSATGIVTFTVTAMDSAGFTDTQNYSITINPQMTSSAAPASDVGVLYNPVIQVSNGTTPYLTLNLMSYAANGTGLALPTVSLANGTVTFNSTPTHAGSVTFTLKATDTAGGTLSQAYTILINPALTMTPTPANLPGGDVGIAYTQVITVANGTTPYTVLGVSAFNANGTGLTAPTVVNAGAVHTVTFNSTPTATGTVTFTVSVTDSAGATLSQNYSIVISPDLTITQPPLASADVGVAYTQVITVANGTTPYTTLSVAGFNANGTGLTTPTIVNSGAVHTVTLHGTPTSVGTGSVTFTVNVTDAAGGTISQAYTVTVNPALTITASPLPAADVGVNYTQAITVANGTTPYTTLSVTGYNANGTGLTTPTIVNAGAVHTVTFGNAPTAAGTVTFTVNVTDSAGGTITKNYTLTVNPALTITAPPLTGADVGVLYSRVITVANGTAPYTTMSIASYNANTTGLGVPTVVNVGATHTITFNSTPTSVGTGPVTFTVNVTDSAGGTISQPYSITVNPDMTIAPPAMPPDNVGLLYSQVIQISNGTTPYTALTVSPYSAGGTGLAAPTITSVANGTITFNSTPTATGTVSFTVNATDSAGGTLTKMYTITINPALTIAPTPATIIGADLGVLYNRVITVSGGSLPYTTFTLTGYNANGTGMAAPTLGANTITFNSTPTATGNVTFTVNVTDTAGGTLNDSYTIPVNPDMTLTPSPLTGGDVGVLDTQAVTVSNGTAPYTALSVSAFNADGTGLTAPTVNLATGKVTFNSTPTSVGTGPVTFTVSATDSAGGTITKNYSLTINKDMTIAPAALPVADATVTYGAVITVSGGTTPYTILNVSSFLANGTGLAAPTANLAAGTLTFNSAATAAGTVTFTVNATDSAGGTLTKNYTVTVNPALTMTPTPAAIPGGDVGVLYNRVITVSNGTTAYAALTVTGFNASGTGLAAPTVSLDTGKVNFNSVPTTLGTGPVTFTVNVTDAIGGMLSESYSIPISKAMTIAPAAMPPADVGSLYGTVVAISNGTAPYANLTVTAFSGPAYRHCRADHQHRRRHRHVQQHAGGPRHRHLHGDRHRRRRRHPDQGLQHRRQSAARRRAGQRRRCRRRQIVQLRHHRLGRQRTLHHLERHRLHRQRHRLGGAHRRQHHHPHRHVQQHADLRRHRPRHVHRHRHRQRRRHADQELLHHRQSGSRDHADQRHVAGRDLRVSLCQPDDQPQQPAHDLDGDRLQRRRHDRGPDSGRGHGRRQRHPHRGAGHLQLHGRRDRQRRRHHQQGLLPHGRQGRRHRGGRQQERQLPDHRPECHAQRHGHHCGGRRRGQRGDRELPDPQSLQRAGRHRRLGRGLRRRRLRRLHPARQHAGEHLQDRRHLRPGRGEPPFPGQFRQHAHADGQQGRRQHRRGQCHRLLRQHQRHADRKGHQPRRRRQ